VKFTVYHPIAHSDSGPDLISPQGITRIARSIEDLGFDGVAFTEHPAPSSEWLRSGGHQTLDPPAALAFTAAVTTRVRLLTYLLVLPYHNPFVAAKAMSTVDILSDGRLTCVVGTGYLQSEFSALGIDMSRRNELFDQSLEVMKRAWTGEPVDYDGEGIHATGAVSLPRPAHLGGPPIYVGGNGLRARTRAAMHDGWSPLMLGAHSTKRARTADITSIDDLADAIAEVRALARRLRGSNATTHVQVLTAQSRMLDVAVEEHREHLHALAEAGVDDYIVRPPGDNVDSAVGFLERYARDFIQN
jgi:probable F420-dependent oxidoreductase